MKLSAAYICNQGKIRLVNQDNLYFHGKVLKLKHTKSHSKFPWKTSTKEAVCIGIFDGMGGEQYGEVASYLAAKILKEKMLENKISKIPRDILTEMCYTANDTIYKKTLELKAKRIGSTAAIVYVQYDRIWSCNVGDSRIYRLREGTLTQFSIDHIDREKNSSNKKPGLTQHLGMNQEEITLLPFIVDDTMKSGDKYLICSDGLTDMVPVEEIENILLKYSSTQKCNKQLLKRALENGGKDNITVITFKVR